MTVILGVVGTFLMLVAATTTEQGDIQGAGSLAMVLFHFIVVMIALPFLVYAVYKTEIIPRWFRNTVVTLSVLNAVLMLLSSAAVSSGRGQFVVFALLELIPVAMLYHRRAYVPIKDVVITS